MSLFNTILQKLGLAKKPDASTPASSSSSAPTPMPRPENRSQLSKVFGQSGPSAVPMVDVVSKLEKMASENSEKLDWKVSIVDLLKLLELDSSPSARKELATELGCPADMMSDLAKMNTWLHKTVLAKIAQNGGNIPKELLD